MRPLLLVLALAVSTSASIGYSSWKHPHGEYSIEYPSDWKRSLGIHTVSLRPSGRRGGDAKISVEKHPIDKRSPATAEAYAKELRGRAGKVRAIESDAEIAFAGGKARRIALKEIIELKGQYGEKLAGPLRELHLVVPRQSGFYVLKLEAIGPEFDKALPEFDRLVSSLRFGK